MPLRSRVVLRALSGDRLVWAVAVLAAVGTLWCGACTGSVGSPGSSAAAGGSGGPGAMPGGAGGGTAFGSCQPGADPGVTPLTKLSTVQYRNTVRDLLASSGLASLTTEIAPALAGVP